METDQIRAAAESYQEVNGKNYRIALADGYAFVLVFEQANFKHLTGAQHLKDIMYHSMAPNQFFRRVLHGAIGDADLRVSVFMRATAGNESSICVICPESCAKVRCVSTRLIHERRILLFEPMC